MKIAVKDFVPAKDKGSFFKSGKIQGFDEVMEQANKWVQDNPDKKIINVETVVLPNIHDEDGSFDTELFTGGETHSQWYQLIRVWFEA